MKKKLQTGLTIAFILACIIFVGWWTATKPRVLILHSYDPEYAWAREINIGLHRILDTKRGFSLRWHYMDTKRHPWKEYIARAGLSARRVVEEWHPDLVIAIDDDAQEQVMKHYVNHPHMQIVFAGINGEIAPYGYTGAKNVSGILERNPWGAIRDALLASDLARGRPHLRLLHLGDTTESVKDDAKYLKEFDWSPLKLTDVRFVESFEEWKTQVKQAPKEADVLLVSNYRRLNRASVGTELVDPKEVVAWTEANSTLPVIGFKVAYGEEGGALTISTSPYEQGEVAAKMAVQILKGRTPASQIPLESTRQFVISMRGTALAARGFRLPSFYESFARATDTYR